MIADVFTLLLSITLKLTLFPFYVIIYQNSGNQGFLSIFHPDFQL